jgi:hypothetical protein
MFRLLIVRLLSKEMTIEFFTFLYCIEYSIFEHFIIINIAKIYVFFHIMIINMYNNNKE